MTLLKMWKMAELLLPLPTYETVKGDHAVKVCACDVKRCILLQCSLDEMLFI